MSQSSIQEFSIQGMSCVRCAAHIEKALCEKNGVSKAVVSFASRSAVVESSLTSDEIQRVVTDLGYVAALSDTESEHEIVQKNAQKSARNNLVLAVVLGAPVIVLGMMHEMAHLFSVRLIEAFLTGVLLAFPGRSFFTRALQMLKQKTTSMDTLVALGAGLSYVWSLVEMLRGGEFVYFETAAAIVAFVLIGKFVEHRMTWRATSSLGELLRLQPQTAERLISADEAATETTDIRFLRIGDLILTRLGERFAADGVIIEGATEADESLLSGESVPVVKRAGDSVSAGTLNTTAPVVYRVCASGQSTRLGEMVAFVERVQLSKPPIQKLADKVSSIFVPAILLISVATYFVWLFALGASGWAALSSAVAVLVVACPCALGLATPIAVSVATSRAARLGLLFRDLSALEALQAVEVLAFDKTGTLTTGEFQVVSECVMNESAAHAQLYLAIEALESASQHPVAAGIVRHIKAKGIESDALRPLVSERSEVAGEGVQCRVNFRGSEHRLQLSAASAEDVAQLPQLSAVTWVVCRLDHSPVLAFALADTVRASAQPVIDNLRSHGIEPLLLSGDREQSVRSVADSLSLRSFAAQTPESKAHVIAALQQEGKSVAMVGDGVNDAAALAQADVGIAMGTGTAAAQRHAALTLKGDNSLALILTALRLSRATFRNIRQNLGWAFGYNVLLIPLAVSGRLTPMWAAAAMSLSSVFVVLNSLRLLRFADQAKQSQR